MNLGVSLYVQKLYKVKKGYRLVSINLSLASGWAYI